MDRSRLESLLRADDHALGRLRDEGIERRRWPAYELLSEIGYLHAALGHWEASREAWTEAAALATEAYLRRSADKTSRPRTPTQYMEAFAIVTAFGTREQREALASVPRGAWFLPQDERWAASAFAAEQLRALVTGSLTPDVAAAAPAAFASKQASDMVDKARARDFLSGLVGIATADAGRLFSAVLGLLTWHGRRTVGEWDGSNHALASTWGLACIVLADEAGYEVGVASSWVPLPAARLRMRRYWTGPWESKPTAVAVIDAAMAGRGYRRVNDVVPEDRLVELHAVDERWWCEAEPAIAVMIGREAGHSLRGAHVRRDVPGDATHASTYELEISEGIAVPQDVRETQLPGSDGAALHRRLVDAWRERFFGEAATSPVETLRYRAEPKLADPELERIRRHLSEAASWSRYGSHEPVQIDSRTVDGIRTAVVVMDAHDWDAIVAALDSPD